MFKRNKFKPKLKWRVRSKYDYKKYGFVLFQFNAYCLEVYPCDAYEIYSLPDNSRISKKPYNSVLYYNGKIVCKSVEESEKKAKFMTERKFLRHLLENLKK
jgi:hypothetical protein